LYIARPCQYVDLAKEKNCDNKFWTGSRFSQKVINDTNRVINKFIRGSKLKEINIYGYSGGAAIAVLIASKRNDIRSIGTIAGNLNHKALMKFHKVTPLKDSLDAIDVAKKVSKIKQYHLIGGEDKVVTKDVIMSFISKSQKYSAKGINFKIINGAGHRYRNWPNEWAKYLKSIEN
jgi:dienelactone hydrolase